MNTEYNRIKENLNMDIPELREALSMIDPVEVHKNRKHLYNLYKNGDFTRKQLGEYLIKIDECVNKLQIYLIRTIEQGV